VRSVIILIALSTSFSALADQRCTALYRKHIRTDLSLSYEAFDQKEGNGFRVLAASGCNKEAADLIEDYIRITGAKESSLRWHISQLRASAGNAPEAIRYAKSVLKEREDFSKSQLRWNDYVLATIAFLERDRTALVFHRDKVADGRYAHHGNEINLKLLNGLVKHFDKDYAYASAHLEDDE
jgi:hypothetical protein